MDLQWWVLLLCSCMYVCMQRPHCCLPGLCRGLWKTHRVTQRGYVQPRLLQKLNCHAEEDVSRTENRNNEKPHERLRKEQQWCGNGNAKLTAAAANWAVVATASSQKKKKGQAHNQAWMLAWNTTKGAPSPAVIQWCRASYKWLCVILQLP